jgi:hypothetical protein
MYLASHLSHKDAETHTSFIDRNNSKESMTPMSCVKVDGNGNDMIGSENNKIDRKQFSGHGICISEWKMMR